MNLRFCPECDQWKVPASIRPTIVGDYVRCAECVKRELAHRSCGECRECCISVAVDQIDKPSGTACEHLCAEGCGVYDTRPGTCESFECMWLHGESYKIFESEELRPDRCGAVFYPEPGDAVGRKMVMTCQVRTKDVTDNPIVRKAIEILLGYGEYVAVVWQEESILLTLENLMDRIKAAK